MFLRPQNAGWLFKASLRNKSDDASSIREKMDNEETRLRAAMVDGAPFVNVKAIVGGLEVLGRWLKKERDKEAILEVEHSNTDPLV